MSDGTWLRVILLDDGWCSKRYWLRKIYECTIHHRFWLASSEHLNIQNTKYKHKYLLDLDCFETRRNVFNSHSVYPGYYNNNWLHKRVTLEIVTPWKPLSTLALRRSTVDFLRVTISNVTLACNHYLYNIAHLVCLDLKIQDLWR